MACWVILVDIFTFVIITLTCLKISSSSRLLLSSTCLRPLSSASLMRLWRSANMEKAWIRRSSCRRISSLLRKSNISPRLRPSTLARASSTNDSYTKMKNTSKLVNDICILFYTLQNQKKDTSVVAVLFVTTFFKNKNMDKKGYSGFGIRAFISTLLQKKS